MITIHPFDGLRTGFTTDHAVNELAADNQRARNK